MFEIFKIGFLTVSFIDVIDVTLVTFIFYKLYSIIKGTIASQIFFGLILVLFLSFVAQAINLKAVGWILKLISDIWVIAFIILFQPEIRRLLVLVGRTPLLTFFVKGKESSIADLLTETAFELAQHQHGALIVLVKTTGLKGVVETGEIINSKVNKNLLRSIFFPRSPLHDGAVIIRNDIIEAARCTLPLSQSTSFEGAPLGMRHRAGIGITEQADVICLIVSEESGSISLAENGKLKRGLSREALKSQLIFSLKVSQEKNSGNIFNFFKQK